MANTLFSPSERLLVEERLLDTPAYEFLAGACERLMNGEGCSLSLTNGESEAAPSKFRLHPAELFYQCFFILDTLKCKSPSLQVAYCDERLWDELLFYLREGENSFPLTELHLVIGCIMQGAAELLLCAGTPQLSVVAALTRQIQRHAPLAAKNITHAYKVSRRTVDEDELSRMMGEYMKTEEKMYSEDINEWLEEMDKSAASVDGNSADLTSSVRIANKKKTSVLVVLNAMYKAGWFVGEDGGELTSRDTTLNAILRHAFGIDKDTAISQTINPSNNINANEKNQLLLHRLLDDDEMEGFIKELQEELQEAYEE